MTEKGVCHFEVVFNNTSGQSFLSDNPSPPDLSKAQPQPAIYRPELAAWREYWVREGMWPPYLAHL